MIQYRKNPFGNSNNHLLLPLGIVLCLIYEIDDVVSASIPVFVMFIFSIVSLFGYVKTSKFSLLSKASILFYSAPFFSMWGYMFSSKFEFYPNFLDSYFFQSNQIIIFKLAMVGLIGFVGLVYGLFLSNHMPCFLPSSNDCRKYYHLNLESFLVLAFFSIFLSWIFAPQKTILQASYTNLGLSKTSSVNFSGAGLMSHIVFILLVLDYIFQSSNVKLKKIKKNILFCSGVLIVVYFQLLRGDRDVLGLLMALISLFVIFGNKRTIDKKINYKRYMVVFIILFSVFIIFKGVGNYRSSANRGITFIESVVYEVSPQKLFRGTWNAVLLSPFSAVIDLESGDESLLWGKSYVELIESLPPGPIAKIVGYERPLSSEKGLSWSMQYRLGGTHITVMPLLNFYVIGVLISLVLIGYLLGSLDKASDFKSPFHLLMYCSVFINLWGFFWYGEIYGIRAVMGGGITWFIYLAFKKFNSSIKPLSVYRKS